MQRGREASVLSATSTSELMSIQDSEYARLVINPPTGAANTSEEVATPCLLPQTQSAATTKARKALTAAICFCFVFMIAEFAGGIYTHSLAVLNDAVHMLTDVGTLSISLVALHAQTWGTSDRYSYGWKRAEVVGALASVFTTWALVVWIFVEAVTRMITIIKCADGATDGDCFAIDAPVMLYIGVAGFVANICCALILHRGGHHGHSHGSLGHDDHHEAQPEEESHGHSHDHHGHSHNDHHGHSHDDQHGHGCEQHGHSHEEHRDHDGHHDHSSTDHHGHSHDEHSHDHDHHDHGHEDHGHSHSGNMNLRGAFLHVIGDCLQSLGVVVAAGIIWGLNHKYENDASSSRSYANIADPLCSVMFGVITMFTTINLFRDIFRVLMECTPRNVSYTNMVTRLREIRGVTDVQDLHIWSIGTELSVLSCHLRIPGNTDAANIKRILKEAEKISKSARVDHPTIQLVFCEDH